MENPIKLKIPCDSCLDFPKPSILYCIRFGGLVPAWVNGIGGGGLRGKYGVMGVGRGVGGLIGYLGVVWIVIPWSSVLGVVVFPSGGLVG